MADAFVSYSRRDEEVVVPNRRVGHVDDNVSGDHDVCKALAGDGVAPVAGEAGTGSCPCATSLLTTLPPMSALPPMTTIFMTLPPVVGDVQDL